MSERRTRGSLSDEDASALGGDGKDPRAIATANAAVFWLTELGVYAARMVRTSYLFLVVSMRLLGGRRIVLNLLVSALSLAAIYVIFQTVFSVVLPKGVLLQRWLS